MNRKSFVLIVALVLLASGTMLFMHRDAESITEEKAVELIKANNPALAEYPSDALPPRSIEFENGEDGMYVAFIQNGSGVRVLGATCFRVSNEGEVVQTGTYKRGASDNPSAFIAPKTCTLRTN